MARLKVLLVAMGLWLAMGHAPLSAQFYGGGETPVDKQAPPSIADLERGCSGGNAADCDILGMRHLRGDGVAEDPKKAVAYFQRACDRGDAPGCFNLGESYRFGDGVPKDLAKAAAFYQRACDGRDPKGCAELAMSYIAGDGVKASEAQAALYADRACTLNSPLGCAILGMAYADGVEGYPKDVKRAADLLFDACHRKVDYNKKADDAARLACPAYTKLTGEPACVTLSVYGSPTGEVRKHCFDAQAGWVTTVTQNAATPVAQVVSPVANPDPKVAAKKALEAGFEASKRSDFVRSAQLFDAACKGGEISGCSNLGWQYDNGKGVAQNFSLAAVNYAKGCDAGEIFACNNLGSLYENGSGVKKDRARAALLYARSCDAGKADACHFLGKIYAEGDGVKRDYNRAIILHERACDKAVYQSCKDLGDLFYDGNGGALGKAPAYKFWSRACSGGLKDACFNLGYAYREGIGVPENLFEANRLWLPLCNSGDMGACRNIGWNFMDGGIGLSKDGVKALFYGKKSCDGGNGGACVNVGWIYEFGQNVGINLENAKIYYQKGCSLGEPIGCSNYSNITRPARVASRSGESYSSSSSSYDSGAEDFLEWEQNRYVSPPYVPPPPVTPIGGAGGFYGCFSPPCM